MSTIGTTIFFTSALSLEEVILKFEKIFNRESFTRDEFEARVFIFFGFYELMIDACSPDFDKEGDLYMLNYVCVYDNKTFSLKELEPAFNNYFNSLIVASDVGIPVTESKEIIKVERLTKLTGKVYFNTDKGIEVVVKALQKGFKGEFLLNEGTYKSEIFGLTLQLTISETFEDKVKYLLEVVDCQICKGKDCDEEDISLYLKNIILETNSGSIE